MYITSICPINLVRWSGKEISRNYSSAFLTYFYDGAFHQSGAASSKGQALDNGVTICQWFMCVNIGRLSLMNG